MKSFIYRLLSLICIVVACIILDKYDLHWNDWEFWVIAFSFMFSTILAGEANNE